MFGKLKSELTLGIFIFIGLVILVILVLSIGDFKTWHAGYNIFIKFGYVDGVKVGAPVRFAGVDVGEVKDMDILLNPKTQTTTVRILAWIGNDIKMPVDSTVWVNTLGLLGEKYIEIMPGKNYDSFLNPGDTIVGSDPIAMHEVAQLAKDIASNIDESIVRLKNKEGTLGRLLYDETLYKDLEELMSDLKRHPWKLFWKTKEKRKR